MEELERITFNAIQDRLTATTPARKFWGECSINIETLGRTPNLWGLVLQESGRLTISRSDDENKPAAALRKIELNGGSIALLSNGSRTHSILISDSRLARGYFRIRPTQRPANGEEAAYPQPTIIFFRVTFGAAEVNVEGYNAEVIFQDCVFLPGAKLNIHTTSRPEAKNGSVSFKDCRFETELFKSRHFGPDAKMRTGAVSVDKDCTYGDGIQKVRVKDGQPTETSALN